LNLLFSIAESIGSTESEKSQLGTQPPVLFISSEIISQKTCFHFTMDSQESPGLAVLSFSPARANTF